MSPLTLFAFLAGYCAILAISGDRKSHDFAVPVVALASTVVLADNYGLMNQRFYGGCIVLMWAVAAIRILQTWKEHPSTDKDPMAGKYNNCLKHDFPQLWSYRSASCTLCGRTDGPCMVEAVKDGKPFRDPVSGEWVNTAPQPTASPQESQTEPAPASPKTPCDASDRIAKPCGCYRLDHPVQYASDRDACARCLNCTGGPCLVMVKGEDTIPPAGHAVPFPARRVQP